MQPKVTLYIAASLDGYIARPDGGIDWLRMVERPGEDYGYAAFYDSVDGVISGSKTFELARSFEPWPYAGKPCYVFSARPLDGARDDVIAAGRDIAAGMATIRARGHSHLWLVGGGALINSFQRAGLIDEYIVSTIPLLLGAGIPLFPPPGIEQELKLLSCKHYESGLTQNHYRRI